MALAISVVYEAPGTFFVPGYQVTVTGMSGLAGAATVTVNRVSTGTGALNPVRGISSLPYPGDSVTATDYEFSYQATTAASGGWSYVVNVYNAAGVSIGTATSAGWDGTQSRTGLQSISPYTTAVLQSIQQPALSLPVVIGEFSSYSIPARILGSYNVLGRANPVILTDVLGSRNGTFQVLFQKDLLGYSLIDVSTLLTFNDTFLLQPFFKSAGISDMYFKLEGVTFTRGNIAGSMDVDPQSVTFDIQFTEVDRPLTSGLGISIVTWQNVLDQFTGLAWNDVLSHRTSWLDVLNRGNSAP